MITECPPTEKIGSLLVFSDDWGRHPSSCQHLTRNLLDRYPVLWVNTIGTRAPRLDRQTLRRVAEKILQWGSTGLTRLFSRRAQRSDAAVQRKQESPGCEPKNVAMVLQRPGSTPESLAAHTATESFDRKTTEASRRRDNAADYCRSAGYAVRGSLGVLLRR